MIDGMGEKLETKDPLKNNFAELAPRFASDSVATD
jgi:hypothetical protein